MLWVALDHVVASVSLFRDMRAVVADAAINTYQVVRRHRWQRALRLCLVIDGVPIAVSHAVIAANAEVLGGEVHGCTDMLVNGGSRQWRWYVRYDIFRIHYAKGQCLGVPIHAVGKAGVADPRTGEVVMDVGAAASWRNTGVAGDIGHRQR